MKKTTFLNFCKELLTEPIGFLDTYFKEDEVALVYKKKLNKILYQFVFFQFIIKIFFKLPYSLFTSLSLEEKLIGLGIFPFFCLLLLFLSYIHVFFIVPIMYRFACWSFQEAIYWTGGTITAQKGINIKLYILAHGVLLNFISYPIELIVRLSSWWQSDLLLAIGGVFLWVVNMMIIIRQLYVNYKIIQKMTNARPLLAVLLDVIISIIAIIICVIAILLVFFFIIKFFTLLIHWTYAFKR